MKKRWLALFLATAMCLSMLPFTAAAEEETPQLWCVDLDDADDYYFEDTESGFDLLKGKDFLPGSGECYGLYYGTESEKKPVTQLTSSDESVIAVETLPGKNSENNLYKLTGINCGSATLYAATETVTDITLTIEVDIPSGCAWYTDQQRTADTYIKSSVNYDPNNPPTLWVIQEDGFSDAEYAGKVFTLIVSGLSGDNVEVDLPDDARVYRQDGTFDIKVSIPSKLDMQATGGTFKLYTDYATPENMTRIVNSLRVCPVQSDEPDGDEGDNEETQLPEYALFSQQAYDEQYLLERVNLFALQDNAVWLIHKDGFSAEDSTMISAEWQCRYNGNYSPSTAPTVTAVARTGGSELYDIKITLPVADANCQLQVTSSEGASIAVDEFWWVEIEGTSVQSGDYLIGYGSVEGDEGNEYLTIKPHDYNRNTNSESTSDARSGLGEWAIYAGTPTDQEDVYNPAPEVGIQINKVWIDVIEGEDNLFSWDEAVAPVVTELTAFEDNICGRLYRLNAKAGMGVIYSNITVTIAGESTNHTIASVMVVEQVESSTNERPLNDTVKKLNEYLQELKAKEADPKAPEDAHYEIWLPAITYTGNIIVPAYEKGTLFMYGESGQGTTLEGCITMEEGANIHNLFDISFRATEEHGDYAITGGSGTVGDCSFYGYDVAIKSGRDFIRVVGNCAFVNNGIGYLHESTDDYQNGYGNTAFAECVFINNGIAISLQKWGRTDPDPFYFRASNSNFIGNDVDFDVQVKGTFYFQANYFGRLVEDVSDADLLLWLNERQLTNINEARRAATVTAGNGANVITNPRWRNALDDMWWFKNDLLMDTYSLRAAETETTVENELICDWDTTTQIVNGEAKNLVISDSAFEIDGDQVVYVVDAYANPVVTWDFN